MLEGKNRKRPKVLPFREREREREREVYKTERVEESLSWSG